MDILRHIIRRDIGRSTVVTAVRWIKILVYILLVSFILASSDAFAQLSPGKLSKAHSDLEGVEHCSQCHDFQEKLSSDKCLTCHKTLGERIKGSKGLHSRPEYSQCQTCHIEHQGRDFQLVYWKDGEQNFDHTLTGYTLENKHVGLKCRKCHLPQNIKNKEIMISDKTNQDHTYLGLDKECNTCHIDKHRGQFKDSCQKCHNTTGWKPLSGFDHSKTNYILTGKHIDVKCGKCHPEIVDNRSLEDSSYAKFAGVAYKQCLDCHQDIHKGKFGQTCETCHNTGGWMSIAHNKFDHNKTNYPLLGKHITVICEKCHKPGKPLKGLKYNNCADCHSDYHVGQFAKAATSLKCEKCHTVFGYSPSKYTIANHDTSGYPLAGSHLAVPCILCHMKIKMADGSDNVRFKYDSAHCKDCHKNPHKDQVDKYLKGDGCEFCHKVDSWKKSTYDHAKAKFALEGKHIKADCVVCHKPVNGEKSVYQFAGLPKTCQECHKDIHQGQFAKAVKVKKTEQMLTDCTRCHTPNSWKAEKFDHARDSVFKLDGAHLKVVCGGCHKKKKIDDVEYAVYKPLEVTCSSCHAGKNFQSTGG